MSVNENENLFSVNEGKSCNTDPTAGAKSEYSWQMSYDITVNKKTLLYSFVFLLSLRKFFNVVTISSCKQELAAINQEICDSQCLGRIRCRRI